jgi:hypothetical protein
MKLLTMPEMKDEIMLWVWPSERRNIELKKLNLEEEKNS